MKRVVIFLISVACLAVVSFIGVVLFGFLDVSIIFIPNVEPWVLVLTIIGISIGVPLEVLVLLYLFKFIHGLFQPKFMRIASNLENVIKRNQNIVTKLGIPQKKEQLIKKMEYIWIKADMQYPLSELDFEKMGGTPDA